MTPQDSAAIVVLPGYAQGPMQLAAQPVSMDMIWFSVSQRA